MLAVVDSLTGDPVDERRRAASELTACLEDDDAAAGLGEGGRCRQAGNAAANHGNVELRAVRNRHGPGVQAYRHQRPSSEERSHTRAAIRARCDRGTRITRLNTS